MAVDGKRQMSAGGRRENIIATFSRELDSKSPNSAASRLDALIRSSPLRPMVVSRDIDGLVSAAILRKAAPGWSPQPADDCKSAYVQTAVVLTARALQVLRFSIYHRNHHLTRVVTFCGDLSRLT